MLCTAPDRVVRRYLNPLVCICMSAVFPRKLKRFLTTDKIRGLVLINSRVSHLNKDNVTTLRPVWMCVCSLTRSNGRVLNKKKMEVVIANSCNCFYSLWFYWLFKLETTGSIKWWKQRKDVTFQSINVKPAEPGRYQRFISFKVQEDFHQQW